MNNDIKQSEPNNNEKPENEFDTTFRKQVESVARMFKLYNNREKMGSLKKVMKGNLM